jgi:hypothetical protein
VLAEAQAGSSWTLTLEDSWWSECTDKEQNIIRYLFCLFALERIEAGMLAKMIFDVKNLFILSVGLVSHIDQINLYLSRVHLEIISSKGGHVRFGRI